MAEKDRLFSRDPAEVLGHLLAAADRELESSGFDSASDQEDLATRSEMPEPTRDDERVLPVIVVVGVKDGRAHVVVGPYSYEEDAVAFVQHAMTEGPDDTEYQVFYVTHPVLWHRANLEAPNDLLQVERLRVLDDSD